MRRGCTVMFVHFTAIRSSRASQEKVRDRDAADALPAALTPGDGGFGELRQQSFLPSSQFRVVIYRRLMLRIAGSSRAKWKARALVTGEVVGQVASQNWKTSRRSLG